MELQEIEKRIAELAATGRRKIGFVLREPLEPIVESLKKARDFADLVIVGVPVSGFETVETSENHEKVLVDLLLSKQVDGIVRGQCSYYPMIQILGQHTGKAYTDVVTPAVVKDYHEHVFVLALVNDFEGQTIADKVRHAETISYWLERWGIRPKVAVMTAQKSFPHGIEKVLDRIWEEAEVAVERLQAKGINAAISDSRIDKAIAEIGNVILPVNGIVGHQLYRAICLLGGGKPIAVPILDFRYVVCDQSSREEDFLPHLRFAAAWANLE